MLLNIQDIYYHGGYNVLSIYQRKIKITVSLSKKLIYFKTRLMARPNHVINKTIVYSIIFLNLFKITGKIPSNIKKL